MSTTVETVVCPARGCQGTDAHLSDLIDGWLWCPDCRRHLPAPPLQVAR